MPWYEVLDAEGLLEQASRAETPQLQQQLDPFWAATWRAAEGLANYLESLDLQGQRVLELGCGAGRVGLAAAVLGAHVTMTDVVDLAMQVARLNTWPVRQHVEICPLVWGTQTLSAQAPFPLIVGSDLVYDPALFDPLERCARAHIASGGRLLITEPHRHTGDQFERWIAQRGWSVLVEQVTTDPQLAPIRLFDCRLH